MRKLIKTAALSCIICLCSFTAAGAGNSHAGVKGNGTFAIKAEAKQAKKVYKYKQAKKSVSKFDSIKADNNSLDIVINKSGSKDFYISYNLDCYNSSNPISYKIEDGMLYIKESKLEWPNVYWDKGNKRKSYSNKIYVYIPSDTKLKKFDFDSEMGDLYIKNISMEYGKINTDCGDIDITGSKFVGKIDIKTESGDVDINKSVINKTFNIKTECGDIDAVNLDVSGNADIWTSSGDVEIMFNKKSIEKLGITMVTRDGDMYINKLYKGRKRKKEDGYIYKRNVNGDKDATSFLNVFSECGDIGLN